MQRSRTWIASLCDPDPGKGDVEILDGAGLTFVACELPMFFEPEL
jgi:hypothetical protein